MVVYDLFFNVKIVMYVDYKDMIEEVVEGVDIVILYVFVMKYNYYLFNVELFKYFKKGVVFVNCVRGFLVDIKVLLDVLDNGVIKGVVFDMYEFECKFFLSD